MWKDVSAASGRVYCMPEGITKNKWYHFVVVVNWNVVTFYVDGSQTSQNIFQYFQTNNQSPSQWAPYIRLKLRWKRMTSSLNYLDDIKYYQRALSASEVMWLSKPCGDAVHDPFYFDTYTCPCAAGEVRVNGACTACAAGKWALARATVCTNCSAGTYSNLIGATNASFCVSCPEGSFSSVSGATSANTCVLCPVGLVSNAGAIKCRCNVGSVLQNGVCVACAAGKWAVAEATACTNCSAGTYSGVTGATSAETCVKCPADSFSSVSGATSANTCVLCPVGLLSNAGASACTCDAGRVLVNSVCTYKDPNLRLRYQFNLDAKEKNSGSLGRSLDITCCNDYYGWNPVITNTNAIRGSSSHRMGDKYIRFTPGVSIPSVNTSSLSLSFWLYVPQADMSSLRAVSGYIYLVTMVWGGSINIMKSLDYFYSWDMRVYTGGYPQSTEWWSPSNADKWTNFVVLFEKTSTTWYVNGNFSQKQVFGASTDARSNYLEFKIGGYNFGGTLIDDVRVYDRQLNENEIKFLYKPCDDMLLYDDDAGICRCNPGFERVRDVCVACTTGKFSETGLECASCPAGSSFSVANPTSLKNCSCNAGFYGPNGDTCTACASPFTLSLPGSQVASDCGCATNRYKFTQDTCVDDPNPTWYNGANRNCMYFGVNNLCWVSDVGVRCQCSCRGKLAGLPNYYVLTCGTCPTNSNAPSLSSAINSCKCNAGYSGPDGGVCTACVAGKFKNVTGNSACIDCPTGVYSSVVGATSVSVCIRCAVGKTTSTVGASAEGMCVNIICTRGRYLSGSECIACPAGTFSTLTGATNSSACTACVTGKFSGAGSSACVCDQGYEHICLAGTCVASPYSSTACARMIALIIYKPSFSSVSGRLNNGDGTMPTYDPTGGPNGQGHVTFNPSSQQYLNFWSKSYNLATNKGLTIVIVLRIPNSAWYGSIFEAGPHSTVISNNIMIKSYTPGTIEFTMYDGGSAVFNCYLSNAVQYNVWFTIHVIYNGLTDNTQFTVNNVNVQCVRYRAMRDIGSTYSFLGRSIAGTWNNYFAGNIAGAFVVDEFLSQTARTEIENQIRFGVDLTQPECNCPACTPGKYKNEVAGSTCINCPAGSYSNVTRASACIGCPAGSFSTVSGAISVSVCLNCTAGRYSLPGSSACILCPNNTFSGVSGAGSCQACQANALSAAGSVSQDFCYCMSGYAHAAGEYTCRICNPGTWNSQLGRTACSNCSMGLFSVNFGAVSNETCLACPLGQWSPEGSPNCNLCALNSRAGPGSGSLSNCACDAGYTGPNGGQCSACPAGQYKNVTGSSACIVCAAGTYSIDVAATNVTSCIRCQAGAYSIATGASSASACVQCAAGTYSNVTGSSACVACPAGMLSLEGASACFCPANTYGLQGQGCVACLANQSSPAQSTSKEACVCNPGYTGPGGSSTLPYYAGATFTNLFKTCGANMDQDCTCQSSELGFFTTYGRTCYKAFDNDVSGANIFQAMASVCTNGAPDTYNCYWGVSSSNIQPYIMLNFGQPVDVTAVEIYSSYSSGQAGDWRPKNFDIFIGASTTMTSNAACATNQNFPDNTNGVFRTFVCVGRGQYLFIRQGSFYANYLQINEMRVPGSIPEKNNPCPACAAGSFKNVSGSAACTNCSRALYSLSGATTCLNCTDGYFVQFPNAPSKCLFNLTCSACPANTYHANGTCVACPGNTSSSNGSVACQCKAGFTGVADALGNGCQACPAGTYKRMRGTSACRGCPANTWSAVGSALCYCNTGYTAKDGDVCVACVAGTYKNVTGSAACVSCAANRSSVAASTNVSQCVCNAGHTQVENEALTFDVVYARACVACEPGKFKPLIGVQACTTCAENQSSIAAQLICSCVPGFTGPDGGPCAQCARGRYKDWLGPQACTTCPVDSSTPDIQSTLLINCTCNTGYTGPNGGPCTACVGGKYKNVTGTSLCLTCSVNLYSTKDLASTSCTECTPFSQSQEQSVRLQCLCNVGYEGYYQSSDYNNNLARSCGAGFDACPVAVSSIWMGMWYHGPQYINDNRIGRDDGAWLSEKSQLNWARIDFGAVSTVTSIQLSSRSNHQYDSGVAWAGVAVLVGPNADVASTENKICRIFRAYEVEYYGALRTFNCDTAVSGQYLFMSNRGNYAWLIINELTVQGFNHRVCISCASGTYKSILGMWNCLKCPANTYHNISTATSVTACQGCPYGSTSIPGETICVCAPGFTGPDGGPCDACEAGKYKNWRNSSGCVACPEKTDSVPGTSLCPCNVGYTGPLGGPCVACVAGKYKDTNGTAACTTCPANSYEPDIAATAVTNCTCNTGFEGGLGGPCTACALGKYKDNNESVPCVPCPEDTYIDVQASAYCKACLEFTKSPSGSTQIAACRCQVGYTGSGGATQSDPLSTVLATSPAYLMTSAEAWDVANNRFTDLSGNGRHGALTGGTVTIGSVSANGAGWSIPYIQGTTSTSISWSAGSIPSTFTICSITRYSGGTRRRILQCSSLNWLHGHWNGNAGGTHYHGQGATEGYSISPNTNWVVVCGRNIWGNSAGVIANGVVTCTGCGGVGNCDLSINRGDSREFGDWQLSRLYVWNRHLSNDEFAEASAKLNSYVSLLLPPCTACQVGTYKDTIGSAWCTSCPVNTFSGTVNATSLDMCTACQWNSTSVIGSASKDYCQCNTGFIHKGEECDQCLPGTFNPRLAQIACSNCTVGTYSLNYAATSNETCASCSATEYSPEGSPVCQSCPPNSVAPAKSSKIQDCMCTVGYTGATASLCEKCAPGKFKDISGNYLCQSCPPNSYTLPGATNLTDCFCNAGFTGAYGPFCVGCAIGKYKSGSNSSACTECPANTYADRQGMTVCTSCVPTSASPVGSVSIWNCTCNAGYKGPTYEETISHENFARSCGLGRSSACAATQSSTFKAQVAVGVLDFINHASLANDNLSPTFSMTAYASNTWWRVDFERRITVHNVSILYDTFSNDMLHVHVGDTNSSTANLICASVAFNGSSTDWVTTPCVSALTGRYLYVRNSALGHVTLNEIQVRGTEVVTKIWPDWCEKCPFGTYKAVAGNSACTACPSNTFSAAFALSSVDACRPCPLNSVSPPGSEQCSCDVSFSGPPDACTDCGMQTFKREVGPSTCETCPANSFIVPNASTAVMPCVCSKGFQPV